MKITFEELRKSNNLLVDEKYLFYKINRIFTEKKYAGLVTNGSWWYEYFDEVNQYKISHYPDRELKFYVYFYKNESISLHLKILKNQEIDACFYVDDFELAENPSILKGFQIELCKRLGM
jgi:hypothetical protein